MTRVAKALLFDGTGKLLVLRRSGTHPRYAFASDLPGGIIEDGEEYAAGLAREIREETGIAVRPEDLDYVARSARIDHKLYRAVINGRPAVTLSWEHDRYEWVDPKDIPSLDAADSFMRFAMRHVE